MITGCETIFFIIVIIVTWVIYHWNEISCHKKLVTNKFVWVQCNLFW